MRYQGCNRSWVGSFGRNKDRFPIKVLFAYYGNTGCGVFKRGDTKLGKFLHKNQHTQRKLLYVF